MIYLDNNATTEPTLEVALAVQSLVREGYANPSSMHTFGANARHSVEKSREWVARLLGCQDDEIIFNSGATEGNSTAIFSALEALPDRKHIITTCVEHPSILEVVRYLGERSYRVSELSVDHQGHIDLEELRHVISGDTVLVTAMWANNETGVINPITEIAAIAKEFGALFHVDAAQAPAKLRIDLKTDSDIDMLSISGHKFHGIKGSGALFVRAGTHYEPLLRGGHQESGRRAGTENMPGIVAMGLAARQVREEFERDIVRIEKLRDRFEKGVLERCNDVIVNGDTTLRLANTTNIGFKYIEAQALLMMLDAEGICISAGSACQAGSMEPSYVLQAMGVPLAAVHGSVRFCFSRYSNPKEVDTALEKLVEIVKRLREMSPFSEERPAKLTPEQLAEHTGYFATVT